MGIILYFLDLVSISQVFGPNRETGAVPVRATQPNICSKGHVHLFAGTHGSHGQNGDSGQRESHRLRTQLLATNQSLLEAKGHWESCQKQLKTLEQNLTSQVVEAAQREMKKCQAVTAKLQQELSGKMQDLEVAQHQNQQQREECDARIQEVQAQHDRISISTCSGAWILGGPITALLPLTLPGFLLLLLL